MDVVIDVLDGVASLDAEAWNRVAGTENPFLSYAWLATLEETGCAVPAEGWTPRIITAWEPGSSDEGASDEPDSGRRLVGALPMYEKTHSAGEFVFDWSWADAAQRAGIPYYPKGVVAVPFTPVTGKRLLAAPGHEETGAIREALVDAALDLCDREGLSSVHFDFVRDEEREVLDAADCLLRQDVQYQWYNGLKSGRLEPYEDFQAFLGELRSKRRSNIKRERRKLREAGVSVRVIEGSDVTQETLDAHMQRMFGYYRNTVNKFFYGNLYLNEAFFLEIGRKLKDNIHLVVAEQDGEEYAGAFNLTGRSAGSDVLWGRYWGQRRDIDYTHFEVCFYRPVEWCIDEGFDRFEAGAGGDHKHDRGFQPTRTYSAHHIRHPRLAEAIGDVIRRETRAINHRMDRMERNSPFKKVRSRAQDDDE